MALLLYKSNEMYSSTELIRDNTIIFEKIREREIEKAVILEEGKPRFLLMDFEQYEEIVSEYEELQSYVNKMKKAPLESKESNDVKQKEIQEKETESKETESKDSLKVVPKVSPVVSTPVPEALSPSKAIEKIEKKEVLAAQKEEELTEEEEINNALKSIANMNFDDDMKLEAELKVKTRILQARAERLKILEEEKKQQLEEAKEDRVLQQKLKQKQMKKDKELSEFWD